MSYHKEIWKTIKHQPMYEVSNFGNIKSKDRIRYNGKAWYNYKGRVLTGTPNPKGYLVVRTSINGKKFSLKIHIIIKILNGVPQVKMHGIEIIFKKQGIL